MIITYVNYTSKAVYFNSVKRNKRIFVEKDSLNMYTFLQKQPGDIAILAICKHLSKHIFKTNTLMQFFVLNYQQVNMVDLYDCWIIQVGCF